MPKELKQIFVKPAVAGQVIRDEHKRRPYAIDPDGELVPRTTYWIRKIRMGDVVECEPTVARVKDRATPMSDETVAELDKRSAKSKRTKKDED